ncbi:hypothetical protein [Burkholderia cenocepacia]|uniref:hypothetical protein n=1 Tax=Burkholderia cenocepacia TaxID=95486 RepID=UPI002AAFF302|nr:hypothetical protein [Burkholderia cenocepacia]
MGDSKQVMCIEQKRQITGWRLATTGNRSGPEATARRGERDLQGAGWIAEANSYYFMEISKSFQSV